MAQALLLAYRSSTELAASATEQTHIKRVMHHVVPVTVFSAEVWVPKAAYQHDSRAGALETDYLLPSSVALGQIGGNADELQQYSPRSFPQTPRSRYAVLARGYSHADNILYAARDRLRQLAATRERFDHDAIVASAHPDADRLPSPAENEANEAHSAPGQAGEPSAQDTAPARAESVSSGATAMLGAATRAAQDAGIALDPTALRSFYTHFLRQMEEQEEERLARGLPRAAAPADDAADCESDDGEGHASVGGGALMSVQEAVARGLAAAGLEGDATPTSESSSAAYSLHSLLPTVLPGSASVAPSVPTAVPSPSPPHGHSPSVGVTAREKAVAWGLLRRVPLPVVPEASVVGAGHEEHRDGDEDEGEGEERQARRRGHRPGSMDRTSSADGSLVEDGLEIDEGEYLGEAVSVYARSELVPAAVRHADDAPAPPLSPRTAFSAALAQAQAAVQEEAGKAAVAQLAERERELASHPRTVVQTHTFKHSFLHPRTIEAKVVHGGGQEQARARSPSTMVGQARTPPAHMYGAPSSEPPLPQLADEGGAEGGRAPVVRQDVPAVEATAVTGTGPGVHAVSPGHAPIPPLHVAGMAAVSSPTLGAALTAAAGAAATATGGSTTATTTTTTASAGRAPFAPSAAALFARMAAFDADHVHPALVICCGGHGVSLAATGAPLARHEGAGGGMSGQGGKARKKGGEKPSRDAVEADGQGAWSWAHVQGGLSLSGLASACMRSGWVGARAGLAIPHYRPRDKSLCYFEFRVEQQALLASRMAPGDSLHPPAPPPVCVGLSARSVALEGVLGTFPLSCGWGSNGLLVAGGQWTSLQMAPSGLVGGPSLCSSAVGPCSYGIGDTVGVLVRWLGKAGPWWVLGGQGEEGVPPFEALQLTFSVNGRVVGCSGTMVIPRDTELYPTVCVGCPAENASPWGGGHWYDGSDEHGAHGGEHGTSARSEESSPFRVVGHFSASDVQHSGRRSLLVTAQYAPAVPTRQQGGQQAYQGELAVGGLQAQVASEAASVSSYGMPAYTPGTGPGTYLAGTVGYAVFALDGSLLLGHEDQAA